MHHGHELGQLDIMCISNERLNTVSSIFSLLNDLEKMNKNTRRLMHIPIKELGQLTDVELHNYYSILCKTVSEKMAKLTCLSFIESLIDFMAAFAGIENENAMAPLEKFNDENAAKKK